MQAIWDFTDTEKELIRSLVRKGKTEEDSVGPFAVVSFETFYELFTADEIRVVEKYLAFDPAVLHPKLPVLGVAGVPRDLVAINGQKYIVGGKTHHPPQQYLPRATYEAYQAMNTALHADLGSELVVLYGYRSPARQVFIFFQILAEVYDFNFAKTVRRVVLPTCSEHVCPTRQAIDFIAAQAPEGQEFDQTREYAWLQKNASRFGFVESYPKDNTLDMMYEPWHWRHE